ncbi:nucleotidyltransferase family protein, partial [Klebsiella pneumoniae]|nr:nucleotidyltransferase family protein [Klebsiella pneumoniae]
YYLIGKNNLKNVPNDILNKWKKDIILSGIAQRKITEAFRNIIDDIILKLNIDIIVLKGIVLKKYYPINELRTMSDFDILIHKNDFQKIKEYLLENHFVYIEDNHPVHATFY